MPLAIDVSNYSGPISSTQARALVAAGVRRVVVGTQAPRARAASQSRSASIFDCPYGPTPCSASVSGIGWWSGMP